MLSMGMNARVTLMAAKDRIMGMESIHMEMATAMSKAMRAMHTAILAMGMGMVKKRMLTNKR
jgi:hypothetical protein